MRLEDEKGFPWTASAGLGWMVLLVGLSFGLVVPALSIYLALWIYTKGRSILPLLGFTLIIGPDLALAAFDHWHKFAFTSDILAITETLIWIASTFLLRREIIRYYRESEGWEISIGPWFTLFFSSLYINYCLNPVTLSDHKNTVTSLNLQQAPTSAKIDQ